MDLTMIDVRVGFLMRTLVLYCTACGWTQRQDPGGPTLSTLVVRAQVHVRVHHTTAPRTYPIESTAHAELDYEEPSDYMVELELVDQLHDDRGAGQGVAVRRESRFASRGFFRRRALSDTPPCPISLSPIPIRPDGGR